VADAHHEAVPRFEREGARAFDEYHRRRASYEEHMNQDPLPDPDEWAEAPQFL
jgi:hypothetical protein